LDLIEAFGLRSMDIQQKACQPPAPDPATSQAIEFKETFARTPRA
jgi:hypothetical protein